MKGKCIYIYAAKTCRTKWWNWNYFHVNVCGKKSKQSEDSCQSKIIHEMKWFRECNLVLFSWNSTQPYHSSMLDAWCSVLNAQHFNAKEYIEIFLLCEKPIGIVVEFRRFYVLFVFCSSHRSLENGAIRTWRERINWNETCQME